MNPNPGIPIWQVDAFADRPFTGNPAAVCLLERFPSDQWMQCVAAEMNLSETSFVVPADDGSTYHLRWFTPTTEVDLCGHATLAAAHTLLEQRHAEIDQPIRFQTRSGELVCTPSVAGITMDFPATPAYRDVAPAVSKQLLEALRVDDAAVLRSKFDLVVVVSEAHLVESLRPSFSELERVETRGVMVTAPSQTAGVDFVSRFFAPRCGINEDPVTGSAHCCLAPYWADRLGTTQLVGYQASSRGGTVHCEVVGDRVRLRGGAVTVMEARLLSEPR
jgi:PhzF family phenazine biosynthesis protein